MDTVCVCAASIECAHSTVHSPYSRRVDAERRTQRTCAAVATVATTRQRDEKLGLATQAYDEDADEDDADARLALVKTANVRLQTTTAGGGDGYSALS